MKSKRSQALQSNRVSQPSPFQSILGLELVFGLVGATGTDLDVVCDELKLELQNYGYQSSVISMSSLISKFSGKPVTSDFEDERIAQLMQQGTALREKHKSGDFVSRLALVAIRESRSVLTGDVNKPAPYHAYIIRSLKRPEEVTAFRNVYGKAFNLVSVYSSIEDRGKALSKKIARTRKTTSEKVRDMAEKLMIKDMEEEGRKLGQKVRDTFPLGDYFVTVSQRASTRRQIERFVSLVFGDPYATPSKDEYAMFLARSVALRSADLSRQVGAAITSMDGDVIALGCNEVPKSGGGLYWIDDAGVQRDVERGHDHNAIVKKELIEELLHKLKRAGWLKRTQESKSDADLYSEALKEKGPLKGVQVLDVIEFGRAVHAEMAAISDAAKRGIGIAGAHLFCTTFPCHICARHIVAAGISRVVYIEPYPKSRTAELYEDSVQINSNHRAENKVAFEPFFGVAPRRYFDFFELLEERKDADGNVLKWRESKKDPKTKRFVLSYISLEKAVVASLPNRRARS